MSGEHRQEPLWRLGGRSGVGVLTPRRGEPGEAKPASQREGADLGPRRYWLLPELLPRLLVIAGYIGFGEIGRRGSGRGNCRFPNISTTNLLCFYMISFLPSKSYLHWLTIWQMEKSRKELTHGTNKTIAIFWCISFRSFLCTIVAV